MGSIEVKQREIRLLEGIGFRLRASGFRKGFHAEDLGTGRRGEALGREMGLDEE